MVVGAILHENCEVLSSEGCNKHGENVDKTSGDDVTYLFVRILISERINVYCKNPGDSDVTKQRDRHHGNDVIC